MIQHLVLYKELKGTTGIYVASVPMKLRRIGIDNREVILEEDDWYTLLQVGLRGLYKDFNGHQKIALVETILELANAKK